MFSSAFFNKPNHLTYSRMNELENYTDYEFKAIDKFDGAKDEAKEIFTEVKEEATKDITKLTDTIKKVFVIGFFLLGASLILNVLNSFKRLKND